MAHRAGQGQEMMAGAGVKQIDSHAHCQGLGPKAGQQGQAAKHDQKDKQRAEA